MFHTILLHSLYKLNGERSESAVYHLLTGKKSAQTMQDSIVFGLSSYFGIYKSLSRKAFDSELKQLLESKYIENSENNTILLSSDGINVLQKGLQDYKLLQSLDGYYLNQIAPIFWQRLLLFIQTASNILNSNKQFVPIIDIEQILIWVRKFFNIHKENLSTIFHELYVELDDLLKHQTNLCAEIIVNRMSGKNQIGFSKVQIAHQHLISLHDTEMYLQCGIHFLIKRVNENPTKFCWLNNFIPEQINNLPLTSSAQKTFTFYKKGISLDNIAKMRRLKLNTIQDHILEIAVLLPEFSISKFVSEESEQLVLTMVQKLKTNRLKLIKENLPKEIDYFTIRLILAKHYRDK